MVIIMGPDEIREDHAVDKIPQPPAKQQSLLCFSFKQEDGGDSGQVAKAKDGMWIYLFYPENDHLHSEKLVNMKHHDYDLEPNVHFSPDGKWIIFRANFSEAGAQSYAVEIEGGINNVQTGD